MKKIVLFALVSVFLLLSVGCVSDDAPSKESFNADSTNSTGTSDDAFGLNETAVFKDLKITATDVKKSSGKNIITPDEGNIWIGVKFLIENVSDKEQTISSFLLFDAYVNDLKVSLAIMGPAGMDAESLDGTIAAGKKMEGYYVIEVPNDTVGALELQVKSSWLSSGTAVFAFDIPQ